MLLPHAYAQTEPQVIISWQAHTYTPPGYAGKALSTGGSKVSASLDVLHGGKLADLSGETFYWYLNNRLISRGRGLTSVSLRAPEELRGSFSLRVEALSYRGGALLRAVNIPIVRPEAVLAAPFPDAKVSSPLSLRGIPFFFNVTDPLELVTRWTVNGAPASQTGNPTELTATIQGAAGSALSIALSFLNPAFDFEAAQASATFTLK
ncbi:MAG: hypothetical protein HYW65_01870 [Candidatus Liptonbacteria bacterium]|nr:hypothetical protein [Candidatus Liptonbacteria bacterium]